MRQGSFLRKGVSQSADPGTRPGLHGQTLISSGHPDLDRLLGGGLPLGSLLLLLEDGWSGHHATLIRYFLAEGAACGQTVLLAAAPAPVGGLSKFLPAQLKGKAAEKDEEEGGKEQEEFKLRIAWQYRRYIKTSSQAGSIPASGLSPGSSPGLGGVVGSRSGSSQAASSSGAPSGSGIGGAASRKPAGLRDWCHRFDLLKPAGEESLLQCQAQLLDCSGVASDCSGPGPASSGTQHLLSQAAAFVQALAPQQPAGAAPPPQPTAVAAAGGGARAPPLVGHPPRGPQHVGRIAVLSLGSPGWWVDCLPVDGGSGSASRAADSSSSRQQQPSLGGEQAAAAAGLVSGAAIVQCLLQLKGLVRDQRCAAVVSVPASQFSASDVARMQHLADCVVALESVADDSDIARLAPDPASVAGLLHLRKLPSLGAVAAPVPEVALHLVRHKRRRLAITPVEIDPEAELADAEAASGAGKSAAAVLCGGATGGQALEF